MSTKLDMPGGGYVIVNNPLMVTGIAHNILDFKKKSDRFHSQLIEMGVKAYRCNDGWVDRENHFITFFALERERGWYWGSISLKNGDKIFIGDPDDGGQFAIIDAVVEEDCMSAKYHYHLIDDYIKYNTKDTKCLLMKLYDWLCACICASKHH